MATLATLWPSLSRIIFRLAGTICWSSAIRTRIVSFSVGSWTRNPGQGRILEGQRFSTDRSSRKCLDRHFVQCGIPLAGIAHGLRCPCSTCHLLGGSLVISLLTQSELSLGRRWMAAGWTEELSRILKSRDRHPLSHVLCLAGDQYFEHDLRCRRPVAWSCLERWH